MTDERNRFAQSFGDHTTLSPKENTQTQPMQMNLLFRLFLPLTLLGSSCESPVDRESRIWESSILKTKPGDHAGTDRAIAKAQLRLQAMMDRESSRRGGPASSPPSAVTRVSNDSVNDVREASEDRRHVSFAPRSSPARAFSSNIPRFLNREYPFPESTTAIVDVIASPTNLKEWGFQDLVAPAGTRAVKVKLFRSKEIIAHQERIFGGTVYISGDVHEEGRISDALRSEQERGGPPMIIVTGYYNADGSRITSLPMTIEFYGGVYKARIDGMVSPFALSQSLQTLIHSQSPPRLDPEDERSVFSYSGMVSEKGFHGRGYFTPLILVDGNSSWTRGPGYFGKFESGRLISRIDLESFGGPLALEAQRKARERRAEMNNLIGMTLAGGLAVMTAGTVYLGAKSWEFAKEAIATDAKNRSRIYEGSGGGAHGAGTPEQRSAKVRAAYAGVDKRDFRVTWFGEAIANHELVLQDVTTGFRMWIEYHGATGLIAGNALSRNGTNLEGTVVSVRFAADGTPTYVARDARGSGGGSCSINSYSAR